MANERTIPVPGIQELLDAGLHFGHQTKRWNPAMKPYIFGERNGIYIIDLAKTIEQLKEAQNFIYDTVVRGRQVLFVGTKKQAQEPIREIAERFNQPYVIHRWLGGMLTNQFTIKGSVKRMRELETMEEDGSITKHSKKEASKMRRELTRLQRNLSGMAILEKEPAAIIVIDVAREHIAVNEAQKLGIPVVALVDTNSDPALVEYPIPGNDDGTRAIRAIVNLIGETIQHASNEYVQVAAEEARQKAIEDAEKERKRKAAEAERKKRGEEEKSALAKAASEAAKKMKASQAAADEKAAADKVVADAKAAADKVVADAKAATDKAAAEKAAAEAPAAEPAPAEEAPAAEAPADAPADEETPAASE